MEDGTGCRQEREVDVERELMLARAADQHPDRDGGRPEHEAVRQRLPQRVELARGVRRVCLSSHRRAVPAGRGTIKRSTEARVHPGRVSIRSPQKPRRRRCCGTRTSDRSAARLPACRRKQAEAWPRRSGRVSPPAPLLRRCPIHRLLCCIRVVLGLDDLSCAPPNRVARRRNRSLLRCPVPRASRPAGFNSSDGGFRASKVPAKLSG